MKYRAPVSVLILVLLVSYIAACQETSDAQDTPATPSTPATQETASTALPRTPSPEGASVYIVSPRDAASVPAGEVTIVFGLKGMGIAPAGIDFPDTGHHHLLINAEQTPRLELPIPADENHIHFGKGQTEATLNLEPGTYTLQLILGDKNHVPHDPPVMSEKVTITVE